MKVMRWALMVVAALTVVSCGNGEEKKDNKKREPQSAEERRVEITKKEASLKASPDFQTHMDRAKADELVKLYANYVTVNPRDSISADYLFKAADLSIGMGKYEASIKYLDRIISDFPKYDRRVEIMLFKGFICETYMNNHANAVAAYKALIEKYPNHRLANDARAAIDNLTLSEDELLEKFKKMNADKPAS